MKKNTIISEKSKPANQLRQRIQKLNKITQAALVVLGIVVIGAIMMLVMNVVKECLYGRHAVQKAINSLPVAAGCHEQSRYYLTPGVDTQSSWTVQYNCTQAAVTLGSVHDSIVTTLKQQGYKPADDTQPNVAQGEIPSYRFIYQAGKIKVDYTLESSQRLENASQTLQAGVSDISLIVTYN